MLKNKTLQVSTFIAKIVVIATGGCGKIYLYTSNTDVSTGDGIAMAYRLGAKISNMEFIQFHPTCLYSIKEQSFLITEAMRGEGAVLLNPNGEQFMEKYNSRKELAPRDIVARAIDSEMKKFGVKHMFLDIHSHRPAEFIKKRFPTIYEKLFSLGIDITKENIPIVPAAHYCCGGIHVDMKGLSSIRGLMAIGECSHTGLHGANRLASNSLLEAIVYGYNCAAYISKNIRKVKLDHVKEWEYTGTRLPREQVFIEHNWMAIRRLMWNYVGVVRSCRRLKEAQKRINIISKEVEYHYWNYLITPELIEMRNLVTIAEIVIRSAMKRKESRGLHFIVDYPDISTLSITTLIVCFFCLFKEISSSKEYIFSSITTVINPSSLNLSKSSLYTPFLPLTKGDKILTLLPIPFVIIWFTISVTPCDFIFLAQPGQCGSPTLANKSLR